MRLRTLILLIIFCKVFLSCTKSSDWAKTDIQPLADRVRTEFLHAWQGYKTYAWGHDDLKPLSKDYHDWYAEPLLMTAVDAVDALYLLGFQEEADRTREYIATHLRFDKDISVKAFEINIRLLGALISSYQLTNDRRLYDLAVDLGNRLLPIFNSPTGMPYVNVNLKTGECSGKSTNPAEIGTYILEFGSLSKLTGDPVYYEKAKSALQALFSRRSKLDLVADAIDIETGKWLNPNSHLGGCIDSYYEYLYKGWLAFDDPDLKHMWETHLQAIRKHLTVENESGLWYGRVHFETGVLREPYWGGLDAFFAGVLALSGDMESARRLQHSGMIMWNIHGLEPELFDFSKLIVVDGAAAYHLRPEISESAFYLYRMTGDALYQQMGEKIFDDLVTYCRTDVGYSHIADVRTMEKLDQMESFFLTETLKYLYLLFASKEVIDLNKYVFNTEAHPLRISSEP